MDIELLSKMVGELILDHDEVGLPGLGSFVAEIVPASFSDRGYTINPPYRKLTFLPGRCEDTSLIDLYAESNGVDKDQAKAILQHFLTEIRKVLQDRKVVVFPNLGRLRATRENNFFFITDEDLDIYPEGFGLQPISLKNHVETPQEVEEVVSTLAAIVQPGADIAQPAPAFVQPDAPIELIPDDEPVVELAPEPVEAIQQPEVEIQQPEEPAAAPVEEVAAPVEPVAEEPAAPAVESAPVPAAEPEPVAEPAPEPETIVKPAKKSRWWVYLLVILAVAVIALAAFVILAHTAPDFIDSILYTPEELRIINY